MRKILFCCLLSGFLFPIESHATFRCKGKLVGGYSKVDVLRYCGEPVLKNTYLKSAPKKDGSDAHQNCLQVDQWSYIVENDYSYTLNFEGGFVKSVITGQQAPNSH